jgi:hypothetical protein
MSTDTTDGSLSFAGLTDAKFILVPLDPTLFPGLSSSIKVHNGFAKVRAK